MVRISSSPIGIEPNNVARSGAITVIPHENIQIFQPLKIGSTGGLNSVNYIVGTATVPGQNGIGSQQVNVLAIAQNNRGQYILIPPGSTVENILLQLPRLNLKTT